MSALQMLDTIPYHGDPCADIVGTVWEANVPSPARRVVTACVDTQDPSFRTVTLTCCESSDRFRYPLGGLETAYTRIGRVHQQVLKIDFDYGDVYRLRDADLGAALLEARELIAKGGVNHANND